MSEIRILLVDDHTILRTGLRMLINIQKDMVVVGEAMNGEAALKVACETKPDVAIMDISMPETNSIEVIEQILKTCQNTRVLVLTMHYDPAYVRATLAAGALGYVIKETSDTELLSAIRTVHQGRMFIDQSPGSLLIQDLLTNQSRVYKQTDPSKSLLSEREREVLQLLAQFYTNQQIAERINVSIKTVESYKSRLSEKLGLRNRADFTRYALKIGLLSLDDFNIEDN